MTLGMATAGRGDGAGIRAGVQAEREAEGGEGKRARDVILFHMQWDGRGFREEGGDWSQQGPHRGGKENAVGTTVRRAGMNFVRARASDVSLPMSSDFEELDFRPTPMGDLLLRRRRVLSLGGVEVFEVKLGEAYLMSSLFHDVEVALADLGLAQLEAGEWDVVVGGLGLGYTAMAALAHPTVRSMIVVDALEAVIDWHRRGLVPLGPKLMADARCRFVLSDFFALAKSGPGFDSTQPNRQFHAVLLDIDHSPRNLLHSRHGSFYDADGLRALATHLHPGGVFAMWSDAPADDDFTRALEKVFPAVTTQIVTFENPILDCESASVVYVARKASAP